MMYQVECHPMGIYVANCYLLIKDKHVLLIDPGGTSKALVSHIKENGYQVDAILLTHGHFDHIAGVNDFKKHFHCPVYIDSDDEKLLRDPRLNCSLAGMNATVDGEVAFYKIGENTVGSFAFEAICAPGHTNGSTMLRFDNLLFSGDVLFAMSIGRCDLPTGSNSKMHQTLTAIKKMNPDLIVYPGHGESTILKQELLHNPFLR